MGKLFPSDKMMHRVSVSYQWDNSLLRTFISHIRVGLASHDQCEKSCTSFPHFLPPFLWQCVLNAWHFKGARCLHLVCIWKDINFYSPACIVSEYMAEMACHKLPYVLRRTCDLTKHLNRKTEIALCYSLQFGAAWGLKAMVSHTVTERVICRGFIQVPAAIYSPLTGKPLYGMRQDAKLKKEFYQSKIRLYFPRISPDMRQNKSCLTPMQSRLA